MEDLHLDEPLIDLEVYGPDKPTAHTLATATRTALFTVRGTTYGTAWSPTSPRNTVPAGCPTTTTPRPAAICPLPGSPSARHSHTSPSGPAFGSATERGRPTDTTAPRSHACPE